jgi:hypothetical protein
MYKINVPNGRTERIYFVFIKIIEKVDLSPDGTAMTGKTNRSTYTINRGSHRYNGDGRHIISISTAKAHLLKWRRRLTY